MTVPHDPAHHARLSYTWADEAWHLFDTPEPAVGLWNSTITKGDAYPTLAQAEAAFWDAITTCILGRRERLASAAWDGAEVAAVAEPDADRYHVAYRSPRGAHAQPYDHPADARAAWASAVRQLLADQFPGWRPWQSSSGRWWATRDAPLTEAEEEAGAARTVDADRPEQLAAALAQQAVTA